MSEFSTIRATPEARTYFGEIATAMTGLFSIPRAEAVGRVHEFWAGQAFLSQGALLALFHQPADHWAKQIYYGSKTWWIDEPNRRPAPYPRRRA